MLRTPRPSLLREDRGSATAETAIVLPVVVAMVLVILVAGLGIGAQVRLESAARQAARELARGEEEPAALAVVERVAGDGARASVRIEGDWVRVEVHRSYRAQAPLLGGASWELSADAVARREPHLLTLAAPPPTSRIAPAFPGLPGART